MVCSFRSSEEGRRVDAPPQELLAGTLELLVLKTLALEPMHGWGIAQRIQQMSRATFLVTQGSLYPALVRMKRRGWIRSSWRTTANNRRARYYELTTAGLRQLDVEQNSWKRAAQGIEWILGADRLPDPA
jgi:PadR family transcriptional regulator, regulatory protein PadR